MTKLGTDLGGFGEVIELVEESDVMNGVGKMANKYIHTKLESLSAYGARSWMPLSQMPKNSKKDRSAQTRSFPTGWLIYGSNIKARDFFQMLPQIR